MADTIIEREEEGSMGGQGGEVSMSNSMIVTLKSPETKVLILKLIILKLLILKLIMRNILIIIFKRWKLIDTTSLVKVIAPGAVIDW